MLSRQYVNGILGWTWIALNCKEFLEMEGQGEIVSHVTVAEFWEGEVVTCNGFWVLGRQGQRSHVTVSEVTRNQSHTSYVNAVGVLMRRIVFSHPRDDAERK